MFHSPSYNVQQHKKKYKNLFCAHIQSRRVKPSGIVDTRPPATTTCSRLWKSSLPPSSCVSFALVFVHCIHIASEMWRGKNSNFSTEFQTQKRSTKKFCWGIFRISGKFRTLNFEWNFESLMAMTKLRKYSINAEYTLTTSNHSSHLYVVYSAASDSEQYLMAFYTIFHLFTHHSSSFISSSGFFFSSDFILSTCGYSFST